MFSHDYGSIGWIAKQAEGARVPYQQASVLGNPVASKFRYLKLDEKGTVIAELSWPCQKPPWGRLTAVNANTGEFAWQIPLGVTDQLPEGKRNTGRVGMGGPIVTAGGLVFIGATGDRRFRALDAKTGKELWVTKLNSMAAAVPITYQGKSGKQYVAITASQGRTGLGDPASSDESLYVFALP